MEMNLLTGFIVVVGILNLLRIFTYLIGSDIYNLNQNLINRKKHSRRWHTPSITVVVPAHNEQDTVFDCLNSLHGSNYPQSKLEIIVVNDGSTDSTAAIARKFIRESQNF